MLDCFNTPNDPAEETVSLKQTLPEHSLCGILKKKRCLCQSIIVSVILSFSSKCHLKLKCFISDRSNPAHPFSSQCSPFQIFIYMHFIFIIQVHHRNYHGTKKKKKNLIEISRYAE